VIDFVLFQMASYPLAVEACLVQRMASVESRAHDNRRQLISLLGLNIKGPHDEAALESLVFTTPKGPLLSAVEGPVHLTAIALEQLRPLPHSIQIVQQLPAIQGIIIQEAGLRLLLNPRYLAGLD
jgi:hypothetical protein